MVFGLSGTGVRLAAEKVFAFSGMRTLAELACDVAGHDAPVQVDTAKPEGVFSRVADATMMLRNYRPATDLRLGVEMAMDYLRVEHRD